MSAQYASAMLAQFDSNVALVTSENVNPAGGGLQKSAYRLRPEQEPDSATNGLYFIDLAATDGKDSHFGTGEVIWTGTVNVQLGFYRGGGSANRGDRGSVRDDANDDCMKVSDVLENPDNYNSSASGIRRVLYKNHRRAFDLKHFEVWEVSFFVEWRSDVIRS